jgi:hypothetical protein
VLRYCGWAHGVFVGGVTWGFVCVRRLQVYRVAMGHLQNVVLEDLLHKMKKRVCVALHCAAGCVCCSLGVCQAPCREALPRRSFCAPRSPPPPPGLSFPRGAHHSA